MTDRQWAGQRVRGKGKRVLSPLTLTAADCLRTGRHGTGQPGYGALVKEALTAFNDGVRDQTPQRGVGRLASGQLLESRQVQDQGVVVDRERIQGAGVEGRAESAERQNNRPTLASKAPDVETELVRVRRAAQVDPPRRCRS
ncbi:hypothetical protein ABZ589_10160 [Streptomyces sp. NPDC013313]|uniref:hypothetical protein n=1 Tax=Streptomyces sp. NPDC013313 TaxID=3155603 RepID=UPI0033D9B3A0